MWRNGLLSTLMVLILAACDSGEQQSAQVAPPVANSVQTVSSAAVKDPTVLAQQYKDQILQVLDLSELEENGASVLSLTFSVPLQEGQILPKKSMRWTVKMANSMALGVE